MDPRLAATATAQGGVFTAEQARAGGYTTGEIQRMRRRGRWQVLRPGVYTADRADPADPVAAHRLAVAAAVLALSTGRHAGAVASEDSAAAVWGLGRLAPDLDTVHLASPAVGRGRRYPGVRVRPAALTPIDVTRCGGVPVTSMARTVVDVARHAPFPDAVVLADAALRAGAVGPDTLVDLLARCARWPGARAASRVLQFADARSESVAESLARVRFTELGLPPPRLQVLIRDARGVIGRVDFLFAERVIVEVDGRVKYEGEARGVLFREKQREDRLRAAGYEVVRLTWADLAHPDRIRSLIQAAFLRAGRLQAS